MKILLDESVPRPMRTFFPDDQVLTVQESGWAGFANGDLLKRIDGAFEVFVVADKNMRYQQNLSARKIAIVELPTNRWPLLQLIAPRIVKAVHSAVEGSYTVLEQ
ncbi:hypothetical protein [Nibricoccus sp. IMCC34717]|uniref:hypothetical protein n=1 Tax=Nibricoccus sp. IMCC34717 TaxID=3034021 RepID=UPI00385033DD